MKPHSATERAESGEETASRGNSRPAADPAPAAPETWRSGAGADAQWDDWRWQLRHRITSLAQLAVSFPELEAPAGLLEAAATFPFAITPYYASLIERADATDPIFQMSLPQGAELSNPSFLSDDPLEEDEDSPVPGLLHRYADRALLVATTACAMYCRHCTRKRVTGHRESVIGEERLRQVAAYLESHPEITDVIVSGGDPLTLPTAALERVLRAIRQVPSVEIIRLGTRVPVVLPMRVTHELVRMLRRYHPLWLNTHFNHPRELTAEAAEACARLADAGIPLGNQTVLLRGINDDARVMEKLFRGLVRHRVRPYYLFQCDLVRGIEHFRTPLTRGIEIMEYLRGRVSGLAIPSFCVDAPHGGGKIPLLPNYIVSQSPTHTVLRNFEGMLISYPEPVAAAAGAAGAGGAAANAGTAGIDAAPEAASSRAPAGAGVWELARGQATAITPAGSQRLRRRARRRSSPGGADPAGGLPGGGAKDGTA